LISGVEHAGAITIMKSARGFSTYPRIYSPLPFTLDDQNPEGGTYNFYVRLESKMSETSQATLNGWLATWIDAIQAGGYALAPVSPAGDYVEPHASGVDAYESVVEWAVYKLRADPVAAIHAAINIVANFHQRCQRVQFLEIG
jgi:hypothetical protein